MTDAHEEIEKLVEKVGEVQESLDDLLGAQVGFYMRADKLVRLLTRETVGEIMERRRRSATSSCGSPVRSTRRSDRASRSPDRRCRRRAWRLSGRGSPRMTTRERRTG
jgi:hypothetical protein